MSITVVIHCKNNENSVIKHFVRVFCVRNICDCHKLSELRYKFVTITYNLRQEMENMPNPSG